MPPSSIDGTTAKLGPARIARHQRIALTLLVDGEKPELCCRSPLNDVECRRLSVEARQEFRWKLAATAGMAMAAPLLFGSHAVGLGWAENAMVALGLGSIGWYFVADTVSDRFKRRRTH